MTAGELPELDARPQRAWIAPFLEHLAQTSNVSAAAKAAKVDISTVYRLRRSDAAFYAAWRAALLEGYDNLEMELLGRLRLGELEGGKSKERARRKYENAAAIRVLLAHRQTISEERARREAVSEEEVLASINAKIDKLRERDRKRGHAVAQIAATAVVPHSDGP